MKKLGIALIGTGNIAKHHAEAIQSNENCSLVAVRSGNLERAEKFAKQYNAKAYTDYEALLKDPNVDAVDIVTRNDEHAAFGIKAAEAGKHVLVEKPIATTLVDADLLIATCKKNNVKLSVISQHRFDKSIQFLKKALRERELGKLLTCSISIKWHRGPVYYAGPNEWRAKKASAGGGTLLLHAIHYIDLLQYLMGPVVAVSGKVSSINEDIEVEDLAVAHLKFANGAVGTIESTSRAVFSMPEKLEITGEKGSVRLSSNRFHNRIISYNKGNNSMSNKMLCKLKTPFVALKYLKKGSFKNQIKDFYESIASYKEPMVTGAEGRSSLEIVHAIYESSMKGKEIQLPLQQDKTI